MVVVEVVVAVVSVAAAVFVVQLWSLSSLQNILLSATAGIAAAPMRGSHVPIIHWPEFYDVCCGIRFWFSALNVRNLFCRLGDLAIHGEPYQPQTNEVTTWESEVACMVRRNFVVYEMSNVECIETHMAWELFHHFFGALSRLFLPIE